MQDWTDAQLLAGTAADPECFAVFYQRHLRPVLGYLIRRTGRRDVAAELTAETFAAALAASERYDEELGTARGWLFAIAGNKLADSLRRRRVADQARLKLGIRDWSATDTELERAEEVIDAQQLAGSLEALVADLPDDQRVAVLARVVDERDYADIAAELDCSQDVVRQRVSRGLVSLRRRLERG